jgi:uncharacterized protein (DUF2062 family)
MNQSSGAPPESLWKRRVINPIVAQLKQGTSPDKITLNIALGAVLGIFPIIGLTTLLCGVVAWRLRLNQPLIQLMNYLMYPVHLLLLLPFYRAGETLFQQPHVPIFSVTDLIERFSTSPMQFMADYGMVGLYGVTVWCLVALPLSGALYLALRSPIKTLAARIEAVRQK